ncbi:MAG: endolytic transglycosylase MltG [Acidimicrobiia bacterium]|nr:endolytic transglycosylase MltG [Acidimicrobiia bacterium]MDH3464252.1 endolytic transglycosylase MltG [Acidimicrobiia bacterium]
MTFDPNEQSNPWPRLARTGGVIALVIVMGFAVVGGASYLGRQVGDALGNGDNDDGPVNVEPGLEVTVEIPTGASAKEIGAILAANGVVKSALEFEVAVRNSEAASDLKAGTYGLTTLMNPSEVVAILVIGPVADVYRITVIEGLRVEEILTSLAESSGHPFRQFESALLSGDVTTSLKEMPDDPTLVDWEGLLFPDTYEFSRSAEPEAILQRMASTMEQRVNSIDWTVIEALGLTPYDGIILASLIESEVLLDVERPTVSSVIHNRLGLGMKLDIDATVLYALGTRDIADFDREFDSPYNTYLVAGLPPTPIAAPGKASLEAAANPETTDFLFYVLKDLEGFHAFAVTLEEHNANVAQARADGVLP